MVGIRAEETTRAARSEPKRTEASEATIACVASTVVYGERDLHDREVARGIRAAIAAYGLWGLLTIYWKALSDFDPFELIGWRIALASVVMAAVVTVRGRWSVLLALRRDPVVLGRLTLAALLLTANWTTYVWAVVNGRVIETALGYFFAPLFTMLFGVTILGEHASRLQRLAILFAAAAVVVLTVSYGRPPVVALILALSWSLYGLLKRQVPLGAIDSLAGETLVLALPAVAVVALTFGGGTSIPAEAAFGEWALVALTGVVTAVPLLLFAVAAQRVPFTLLGALQYLVPTINLVLGWAVYDEAMPLDRLVGFALVWAALVAVTVDRLRQPPALPEPMSQLTPTAGD
jgi:chloramphenicol-sensitive protein RarD